MTPPVVLVLINGSPSSAAGERAACLLQNNPLAKGGQIVVRTVHLAGARGASVAHFVKIIRRESPDLIYVVDNAVPGVCAATLYRLFNRRSHLVIDTGDAIEALSRKIGRGRLGMLVTALLERLGHGIADQLVVRGSEHPRYLGRHAAKATVIQDGVHVSSYSLVMPIAASAAFSVNDPLIVGVLGSLSWNSTLKWCYGMELIQAMGHLGNRVPVRGVIIGDGDGLAHLKAEAQRVGVTHRVCFVGRVPPDRVPAELANIHVALSTQTDDVVGRVRTTGKLPLYLAAGRFVLASRVGEAARVLPEDSLVDYRGAFDIEYPRRLADVLAKLAAEPTRLAAIAAHGPTLAQQFDYELLAERLATRVLRPLLAL